MKDRKDLNAELYHRSYGASITVLKRVVPYLGEDDETRMRLSKSVKSISRLIASNLGCGFMTADRDGALSEVLRKCRGTEVMLSYCRDLHGRFINGSLCGELIETYRFVGDEIEKLIMNHKPLMEGLGC